MEPNELEGVASTLGLSPAVVDARLEALGLVARERNSLADAWSICEKRSEHFVQHLYMRFKAVPELNAILQSDSRVERLKKLQGEYLRELFCSPIDHDYVLRRLSIGIVHHKIRITPQWYLASYAHFLCDHVDMLLQESVSPAEGLERLLTLFNSILFDAGLVLDAYGLNEENSQINAPRPVPSGAANTTGVSASVGPNKSNEASVKREPSRSRIRLTNAETKSRSDFLEFEAVDLDRLRTLKPIFASCAESVLSQFYQFFMTNVEYRGLFREDQVERLLLQVRSYWNEFIEGQFDRPYAASRMRIGVIHEHIGVEPQLYLIGLSRQVVGFLRAIPFDTPDYSQVLKSFFRALFFDITFVIDAYMDARADALLRTEGYAHQLMNGLDAAVAVMDRRQRILFANELFVAIVGIEPALLCRMRLSDALHFDEVPKVVDRLLKGGQAKETSTGRFAGILYRITAMRMEEHSPPHHHSIALVLDNINNLVQISRDIESDVSQLARLTDSIPAVLWEMEFETRTITAISHQSIDLTGHRDVWFLGRSRAWQNCIHPDDLERFEYLCARLESNRNHSIEYRLMQENGKESWVRSLLSKRVTGSSTTTITAVTYDITQSRNAEHLRMTAIGQVANGVAHVVNNALTVIMGNIELHANENAMIDSHPYLQEAMRACQRSAMVISQLRSFVGARLLRPTKTTLNTVLQAYVTRLRERCGISVSVHSRFQDNLWSCRVDNELLLSAIENVCSNAIQAMSDGGQLTIETRNLERNEISLDDPAFNRDWVELRFVDNGCGMTEAVRKRAIEPFFTTRNLAECNGLGLSLVYGFMTQSGGHMLIQSEPGRGTEVALRFPRFDEEPTRMGAISNDEKRPLILLVEDDELVARIIATQIRSLGYELLQASNATDALQIVRTTSIDVLVTDILLGEGIDGIELARQVAKSNSKTKIVLISGNTNADSTDLPLPTNWTFLAKPFPMEKLVELLRNLVAIESYGDG